MQESGWCCFADHSEGSDGSGGDALGLGYGSDDSSGNNGEDGIGKEARSLSNQVAELEALATEQEQDSPAASTLHLVAVKEEQIEHKQDDSRTPKTAEVQSLADSSVVESGAGMPTGAVLPKADNTAKNDGAQPCAADAVEADGTGGAAEEQVAVPQGKPASLTNGSAPVQAHFSKGSRY